MLREKFITLNVYIIKEEKSQIGNPNFHLKKLENEDKSNVN